MLAVTDGESPPALPSPFSMESILARRSEPAGTQPLNLANRELTRPGPQGSPGRESPAAAAGAAAGAEEAIDIDVDTEDTDTGKHRRVWAKNDDIR